MHRSALLALIAACTPADLTEGRYQGMVEHDRADLGFEVAGRIAALEVAPGAAVRPGQVLARLDDTVAREQREVRAAELEIARAELALVLAGSRREQVRAARARVRAARASERVLEREVARERELVAKGASTRARLDVLAGQLARARGDREVADAALQELARGARDEEIRRAEARVTAARDALERAALALGRRVLIAPAAAVVDEVHPELGEVVAAGTPVVSVVDPAHPYADVFVPAADLPRLRVGAPIALAVEGDPREVPGVIERIHPRLEFTPRFVFSPRERPHLMARVRVRLDDRRRVLHAGTPAYVRLVPPGWEATQ